MLALIPEGGSFVNLIDRSKIPIGIPVDGSDDKSSLKLIWDPPVSPENESNIFYSSISHLGIRWIFCNITQWPYLFPYSILLFDT